MFSTKTLCQMLFQTCLKGFKIEKIGFLSQKQLNRLNRVNRMNSNRSTPSSTGWGMNSTRLRYEQYRLTHEQYPVDRYKNSLSSRMLVQSVKVEPHPVEVRSMSGRGSVEAQRSLFLMVSQPVDP